MVTTIHLRSGHVIDDAGNVMEFALSRGDLSGGHLATFSTSTELRGR